MVSEQPRRQINQDSEQRQSTDQHVEQDTRVGQKTRQRVSVTVHNAFPEGWTAPGANLSTRVVDTKGAPIERAVFELYFGPLVGLPLCVSMSDENGNAMWKNLPLGFYSVRVKLPSGQTLEQWHLRLDSHTEHQLTLTEVHNQRHGFEQLLPDLADRL